MRLSIHLTLHEGYKKHQVSKFFTKTLLLMVFKIFDLVGSRIALYLTEAMNHKAASIANIQANKQRAMMEGSRVRAGVFVPHGRQNREEKK